MRRYGDLTFPLVHKTRVTISLNIDSMFFWTVSFSKTPSARAIASYVHRWLGVGPLRKRYADGAPMGRVTFFICMSSGERLTMCRVCFQFPSGTKSETGCGRSAAKSGVRTFVSFKGYSNKFVPGDVI